MRKITLSSTTIITYAGSSTAAAFSGDGNKATSAELNYPVAVACDSSGNLYIADYGNNRIRKVTASNSVISTYAGSSSTVAFQGDGGSATSASLNGPSGVAFDSADNLYISDYGNSRIRKVNKSGKINTIAGSSQSGYSGDGGPATSATLYSPCDIAIDSSGTI